MERLKRIEDYKRKQLVRKVNEEARRSKEFEEQKQQMLVERQRTQVSRLGAREGQPQIIDIAISKCFRFVPIPLFW